MYELNHLALVLDSVFFGLWWCWVRKFHVLLGNENNIYAGLYNLTAFKCNFLWHGLDFLCVLSGDCGEGGFVDIVQVVSMSGYILLLKRKPLSNIRDILAVFQYLSVIHRVPDFGKRDAALVKFLRVYYREKEKNHCVPCILAIPFTPNANYDV